MTPGLLQQITAQSALLDEFLQLLRLEANALAQGEYETLAALAGRKAELADRIAAADRAREERLRALGLPTDRTGGDVAARQGGERVQRAWQGLLQLAETARAQNHRNGVVVHALLDFTRQSLAFLQGGGSGRPLYGPDGQARAGAGGGVRTAA